MRTATLILSLLAAGCSWMPPKIKLGNDTVTGIREAGKPASLAKSEAGATVALPAGSSVVITKEEGVPATKESPAIPAKETTTITPAGPTEYHKTESKVSAQTGVVDTSVATHRIDVAERRWLLWAAIACGIGGVVIRSMLPAWAGLSNGLLMGGALAFAAWKFAEVPAWIWAAVLVVMGALALGYKRAEWDKNSDGIPDILQKQP